MPCRAQVSPSKPAARRKTPQRGTWLSSLTESPTPIARPLKRRKIPMPTAPTAPDKLYYLLNEQQQWRERTDPYNGDKYFSHKDTGKEMTYPPAVCRVLLTEDEIERAERWGREHPARTTSD